MGVSDEVPIDHRGTIRTPRKKILPTRPKNKWLRTGKCNRCGYCCSELVYHPRMAKQPRGKGCRFLRDDKLCATRCWVEANPEYITNWRRLINTTDFPVELPECHYPMEEWHFHYWRIECGKYPNPEDAKHTERFWRKDDARGFMKRLFAACGYDMKEEDGV